MIESSNIDGKLELVINRPERKNAFNAGNLLTASRSAAEREARPECGSSSSRVEAVPSALDELKRSALWT